MSSSTSTPTSPIAEFDREAFIVLCDKFLVKSHPRSARFLRQVAAQDDPEQARRHLEIIFTENDPKRWPPELKRMADARALAEDPNVFNRRGLFDLARKQAARAGKIGLTGLVGLRASHEAHAIAAEPYYYLGQANAFDEVLALNPQDPNLVATITKLRDEANKRYAESGLDNNFNEFCVALFVGLGASNVAYSHARGIARDIIIGQLNEGFENWKAELDLLKQQDPQWLQSLNVTQTLHNLEFSVLAGGQAAAPAPMGKS